MRRHSSHWKEDANEPQEEPIADTESQEEPESSIASIADAEPSVVSTEPELTESEMTKSKSEQVYNRALSRYSLQRSRKPPERLQKCHSRQALLGEGVMYVTVLMFDYCITLYCSAVILCNHMNYCVMVIMTLPCCLKRKTKLHLYTYKLHTYTPTSSTQIICTPPIEKSNWSECYNHGTNSNESTELQNARR